MRIVALAVLTALVGCERSGPASSGQKAPVVEPQKVPTADSQKVLTVEELLACNRQSEVYKYEEKEKSGDSDPEGPPINALPNGTIFYDNHVNAHTDGKLYICSVCNAHLSPLWKVSGTTTKLSTRFMRVSGGVLLDCSVPTIVMTDNDSGFSYDIPIIGQFNSERKPR